MAILEPTFNFPLPTISSMQLRGWSSLGESSGNFFLNNFPAVSFGGVRGCSLNKLVKGMFQLPWLLFCNTLPVNRITEYSVIIITIPGVAMYSLSGAVIGPSKQ